MRRSPSLVIVPKVLGFLALSASACGNAEGEQPRPDATGGSSTSASATSTGAGTAVTLSGTDGASPGGSGATNSGGVSVVGDSSGRTASETGTPAGTSGHDATQTGETATFSSDVSAGGSTTNEAPGSGSEGSHSGESSGVVSSGSDGDTAQQGPITVWLAGDSTVRNNAPCAGWGDQFQAHFNSNVTVVNSALAGRGIRQWLYYTTDVLSGEDCAVETDGSGQPRVQDRWQNMLDNMKAGDYLMIQFGINDGAACPRRTSEPEYARVLGMMAQAAEERGAHAVFLTAVGAIACSGSTATGSRGSKEPGSRGFVDETFAAGDEYDVPVIDLHQLSVDLYNELGFCPVPGGDVSEATAGPVGEFFCNDHTHFEASGASAIAGLVAQALVDQTIGLGAYRR